MIPARLWPESEGSPFDEVFDAGGVRDQAEDAAPAVRFVRVPLYPMQAAIVDDPARFTITEATTKAGKTMSHVEWLLERAQEFGRGNHWWVATVSSQSGIAYRRACDRLRGYLESGKRKIQVGEPIPFRKHDTERWIDVFGARVWFKSAEKPDNLYGEDVLSAVGDEVTRWREAAWHALYTTLTATGGRAKLIGNVKGRRNFAYQLARKAETGEPDWGHHRLTAQDAIAGGVLDAQVVEQARRDLPEAVFRELYEAQASDDEGNPFGLAAIRACRISELSKEPTLVYGLDLAKSLDWCVLTGLDAQGRETVHARWQGPWRDTIKRVHRQVGTVLCLVDSTGVGDPVLEELQTEGRPNFVGFKFSGPSKQQLMEGLALAIQQRSIGIASAPTLSELEAFEYEYTRTGVRYSAPPGVHDDCVCSLALARQALVELLRMPMPFAFSL